MSNQQFRLFDKNGNDVDSLNIEWSENQLFYYDLELFAVADGDYQLREVGTLRAKSLRTRINLALVDLKRDEPHESEAFSIGYEAALEWVKMLLDELTVKPRSET